MTARISIDTSKSLAELTGVDWGPAPPDVGTLMRERHEIRRTPIRDLPHQAIVRFLDMSTDPEILVPVALERLRQDPELVPLLCATLRADLYDWRTHVEDVITIRDIVYSTVNLIGEITDDLELTLNQAAIWREYAWFERRLSSIQSGS